VARHLDIADAVVVALNDHAFSLPFTSVRKALPVARRENLAALLVTVIPSTFNTQIADRSRRLSMYGVDIGIQQAVDPDNLIAFDAMFELVEEINNLFAMKRLDGLQAAIWEKVETVSGAEAGYAPEHLESLRLFTAVLRITWKVYEA
jgi:hypothetical protein